ncbi:hypothetical protein CAPTEDRAFT_184009 [Capitella teleta]|uniref:Small monomeric GTPase n=1 Tax=Capitella teleta TaxID=283909 RepID=R7U1E1_CAPTE|nr:hypothetical protein CAPTEDRAFT_184009 [Capitella teleta]|eukprot:ELT99692.1 hypothetical protein CAPTEDRAFT_184009 [Capitella teleta]
MGGEEAYLNGVNGDAEVPVEEAECREQAEEAEGDEEEAYINRVLVLGSQGVGKSTLTQQLMTSEYLANKESGPDDETGDHIVSVVLDDIESMVLFLDTRGAEPVKDRDDVDAFLVVYSVTDRNSFSYAQACLQDICGKGKVCKKAVILVANKQESVRNRAVSEDDGRNLATKRRCKFIEVSALLDHKVDELLVGIIRQMRIKRAMAEQSSGGDSKINPTGCLHRAAFGLFRKLFRRSQPGIARSCDNLLV